MFARNMPIAKSLSNIFRKYLDLDDLQLTGLHRVVLGLTTGDIHNQLVQVPSEINVPDENGRTPLFWACRRGDTPTSMALLGAGADPNIADEEGLTPFLVALSPLTPFSDSVRFDVAQAMVQHGARVTDCTKHGWNAIHIASGLANASILELLLSVKPDLKINSRDYYKRTPLIRACMTGNFDVISFLLSQGADPSLADYEGTTPYHLAAEFGQPAVMEALLMAAVKWNIVALANDRLGYTALHIAVICNNTGAVSTILKDRISQSLSDEDWHTTLDLAARYDRSDCVFELILHGIDIHSCNADGETPLFTAVSYAATSTVEMLLALGATRSDLYNNKTETDALSFACQNPYLFDIVALLLTEFPDTVAWDTHQNTVLHLAAARSSPDLLEELATAKLHLLDLTAVNRFGKTAADYLEEGPMMQERKLAFCRLLHNSNLASQISCPTCGKESKLPAISVDDSDDEDVFIDCES